MKIQWPDNKEFAFTIVDDTDNCTGDNIKPIYDFLYDHRILTTKTVWVYPPRNHFTGDCLLDSDYLNFIIDIKSKGYKIGLHNVGSGEFNRENIKEGIDLFNEKIGFYPNLHINHSSNLDNIYWGNERYQFS
ncbi:hypothetical protein TSYNTROOL_19800 [Tepidanaerobacter syntrophicus]|uniref:hypothetical protein n=1 Tax=Tepidanaerobacter syntrophicus TaxID=224999 RepID=UPI0022EEA6E5|nr:hypothetical protein [Tepidanaerobacter syntrophicus]GLI51894.1 hypothetical protein TSYNTROOL_19800 [Tepidanaerobacter syntrophicus]